MCVCVDAGGVGAVEGAGVGGCVLCVCISLSVCVRVCKEELLLVGGAGVCVRVLCVYVCLCIEELMLLRELLVHTHTHTHSLTLSLSLSLSHTHTHAHTHTSLQYKQNQRQSIFPILWKVTVWRTFENVCLFLASYCIIFFCRAVNVNVSPPQQILPPSSPSALPSSSSSSSSPSTHNHRGPRCVCVCVCARARACL